MPLLRRYRCSFSCFVELKTLWDGEAYDKTRGFFMTTRLLKVINIMDADGNHRTTKITLQTGCQMRGKCTKATNFASLQTIWNQWGSQKYPGMLCIIGIWLSSLSRDSMFYHASVAYSIIYENLHNWIFYAGKMTSLYWIRDLGDTDLPNICNQSGRSPIVVALFLLLTLVAI